MGSPPAFHEGVLVNNVILLWHGVIVVASTPPHHPFFEQVVVDIVTSFETRYSYGGRLSYYVSNGGGGFFSFLYISSGAILCKIPTTLSLFSMRA